MQSGTINDITKLQFYSDSGILIPTELSYVMKWRLIPGAVGLKYIQENIEGYFIGDIDEDGKICSLSPGLINRGKVLMNFSKDGGIDENGFEIFSYSETYDDTTYFNYIRDIVLLSDNTIDFVITINDVEYKSNYNVNDVFAFLGEDTPAKYFSLQTIYIGDNTTTENSNEYYKVLRLEEIDLKALGTTTFIEYVIEKQIPNIGVHFPFVRYKGSLTLESVSTDFIATNTIIVLEKDVVGDDVTYEKPYINAHTKYSLVFQPNADGELHLINPNEDYEIKYIDEIAFSLADDDITPATITPLTFAIGVTSSEEGTYQNYLGIYMRAIDNPDKVYFMGAIAIKSTIIGEDDRFRTLLGNFGIPDPKYYSTLFADQEHDEQLTDYKIVNEKSKQLMISYDQIFNYVGTYKALINAVKFLGYYDLVFKEWYTIKTSNDTEEDIAVQVFDTSTGNYLAQKLASYGISIEDFKNYSKINKLTMIYHINDIDNDHTEKIQTLLAYYNAERKRIDVYNPKSYHYSHVDVPLTKVSYAYRTDEILTKLYAVKKWLEQHIIGVGAYISDITGEFVTFGWQKTQGYETSHHLVDYSQEQFYTPDVKCVLPFKESHGKIACTLNELNNAVRIEDYEEVPFEAFMKIDEELDEVGDTSVLHISNTLEAPVLGDEFEFDVVNHTDHGTLCEWTNPDSSTQIYLEDGEIRFLYDEYVEATIDSSVCLPYITLENANIHKNYGQWRKNIQWMVREITDDETGNVAYKLSNYLTSLVDNYGTFDNYYVAIEPATDDAYVKYSAKNKWGLPVFLIHGYKFANTKIDASLADNFKLEDGEWVLEILKGDMLFPDNILDADSSLAPCCAQLSFTNDNIITGQGIAYANKFVNEQEIKLHYTYHSERKPFTFIDVSALKDELSNIDVSAKVNADVSTSERLILKLDDVMLTNFDMTSNINYSFNPAAENVAYNEASTFMNSSAYIDAKDKFIAEKSEKLKKKYEFDEYVKAYNNNYTFNRCIDVDVTRLGDYEIIARAYDKYNNGFVAKYDNLATLSTKPIAIDTYSSKKTTDNKEFFYRYNATGTKLSGADIVALSKKCDKKLLFPRNFMITDFDYNSVDNSITFDNYSYVIDTPKNNDYVIFENAVEKVDHAEDLGDMIKLYMLDENPDHIKLYNMFTMKINVVIQDPLTKETIRVIDGTIKNQFKVDAEEDDDSNANSYVTISVDEDINEIVKLINNKKYIVTVLNTTEYDIEPKNNTVGSLQCTVKYDYDTNQTSVIYYTNYEYIGEPIFGYEDVVKARYYMDCSVNDKEGSIINETCYRIIDINAIDAYLNPIDFDVINDVTYLGNKRIFGYEYVLDGLLNLSFIQDFSYGAIDDNVHCYLTRANHYPVQYMARVEGDGDEYNYNVGYNNYTILQDYFKFNVSQMFLDYYIDDMYGGTLQDYDHDNLSRIWYDYSKNTSLSTAAKMELYYFHEFPITVEQGRHVMFTHHDSENVFIPGYHVEWKVSADTIDDTDNWDTHLNTNDKEVLYRSINQVLSIKPEMLGAQDIELTCIDKYGNRLINSGSGRLYVTKDDSYKSDLGF